MEYTSGTPRKNPSHETSPAFEGKYLTINRVGGGD